MNEDFESSSAARQRLLVGRPFGDLERAKGLVFRPSSDAYLEAAANLFEKAWDAWEDDRPRALRYLAQASKLPYDEFERGFPAAIDASMQLFNMVVDAFEDSEPGDGTWLEIVGRALDGSDEQERLALGCSLRMVAADVDLEPSHRTRVQVLLAGIPEITPVSERADVTADELLEHLVGVLGACFALECAYQAPED